MRKLRVPIITGIIMIVFLMVVVIILLQVRPSEESVLRVHFLDIGQGDATLIESPTGTQVLIDGGKTSSVLGELQSVMGFFDRDIDMVVATHPDMDHIGGLTSVLERYHVGTILMTENMSETPAFEAFLEATKNEGANIIYARRGQIFDLGNGEVGSTTLTILFPDHDPRGLESNTASIVARLVYGESEFMLTGDSPQEIETYLVSFPDTITSDVLKAGHHGSRTSSDETFVTAVNPTYAVISAGKDNSYGHPHKEVLTTFENQGIQVLRTDQDGRILIKSNGYELYVQ